MAEPAAADIAARRDAGVVTAAAAALSGSMRPCDSSSAGSCSGVEVTSTCSMAIASAPPATTELRTASTSRQNLPQSSALPYFCDRQQLFKQ